MIFFRNTALAFCIALFAAFLMGCRLADSKQPGAYEVKPNDNLLIIADKYGISIEELIALNIDVHPQIARDPSQLKPGMRMFVPNPISSLPTRLARTAQAPAPRVDLNRVKQVIFEQINAARRAIRLPELSKDSRLERIAAERSGDMILRKYFSHIDPDNSQEPFRRYLQAMRYPYGFAGENLAEIKNLAQWAPQPLDVATRYSADDLADEFTRGWMASIEHLANITNKVYIRTGIALAVGDDGRRIVATQVFSD